MCLRYTVVGGFEVLRFVLWSFGRAVLDFFRIFVAGWNRGLRYWDGYIGGEFFRRKLVGDSGVWRERNGYFRFVDSIVFFLSVIEIRIYIFLVFSWFLDRFGFLSISFGLGLWWVVCGSFICFVVEVLGFIYGFRFVGFYF